MKLKKSYRVTALILAFLMFFTSIGYSIDFHYCKGDLKSFSLFGKAASCHTQKKSCPNHTNTQLSPEKEKDCCSNEKLEIDNLDVDYDISSTIDFNDLQVKSKVIFAFVHNYIEHNFNYIKSSNYFKKAVPIPQRDIYVLLERYLL